tara:strand:- start:20142 stop:20390 length:249 start_codon:yes stop_codon:yes gene_type:complete
MKANHIKIKVSLPPWAETDKSWNLLVNKSKIADAWSDGFWFPKSGCEVNPSPEDSSVGILTLPLWLFNKLKENGAKFTTYEN